MRLLVTWNFSSKRYCIVECWKSHFDRVDVRITQGTLKFWVLWKMRYSANSSGNCIMSDSLHRICQSERVISRIAGYMRIVGGPCGTAYPACDRLASRRTYTIYTSLAFIVYHLHIWSTNINLTICHPGELEQKWGYRDESKVKAVSTTLAIVPSASLVTPSLRRESRIFLRMNYRS